jgi:hypothetical protein
MSSQPGRAAAVGWGKPSGPETETPMGFKFPLVSTEGDIIGGFETAVPN